MPPATRPEDERHLARAVELAERGRGRVSPNPVVGAVVERDGEVLGEGHHDRLGGPHAEVAAIADVLARGHGTAGATIHVSLEPCAHEGRTPPCTRAIAAAGLARVTVAADDPSAKAAGRGLGVLRDEGIEVAVLPREHELAARARAQNQAFRKHARTGRPWVMLKAASSLDGRLATRDGDSRWISSETSRATAHRWRAEVDAVACGIGTALADDPRLTARGPDVLRQPRRVVFDSEARLPADGALLAGVDEAPVTVVVSRAAPRTAVETLRDAGAEILVAAGEHEQARAQSAVAQLGEREVTALLLEGGPHLAGAFFDAGLVDELRLFLCPLVIGGDRAPGVLGGEGVARIADATAPLRTAVEHSGADLLVTATLKEW